MGRLWVEVSQCREATVEERPSRRRGVEASRPCLYIREHCPHRHPGVEASRLWRRGVKAMASRFGVEVWHRFSVECRAPDWAARRTASHYSTFMNSLE